MTTALTYGPRTVDIDMNVNRLAAGYTDITRGVRGVRVYDSPPPGRPPPGRSVICNCTTCRPLDPPNGGQP